MAVREIQPTEYVDNTDMPMIFLAGPIQGAPDWQRRATGLIQAQWEQQHQDSDLLVANPRRQYVDDSFVYDDQVTWEVHHLERAAKHGAIIFWFAKQDPHVSYETGRPYAKTTFGELNRVWGWLDRDSNIRTSIGIEEGHKGTSDTYIDWMLRSPHVQPYANLEFVCLSAISQVLSTKR